MSTHQSQKQRAEEFHQLHLTGEVLILPNIWDALGAALLQDAGFRAAATSSSAAALSSGWHDGEKMPFTVLLAQLERITRSVSIPVSADIEAGFAHTNSELKNNITALLETGIVGVNFEDSEKKNNTLIPAEEQAEKIKLIKETASEKGIPLFVNARIDTYVHGADLSAREKLAETLRRAEIYKNAGADCVFPILLKNVEQIRILTAEAGLPVNIMAMAGSPDLKALKQAGVRRISLGSSFLKIAIHEMKRFAEKLRSLQGSNEINSNPIDSKYLNGLIPR